MNRRHLIAAGLAAALLGGTAACADGAEEPAANSQQQSGSITVWLQPEAQSSWPDAVTAATDSFRKKHPGVEVKVQYLQWADHLTKLDAALAGSTPPDVVEMGNTEMTKYAAAGAFADLSDAKGRFENSGAWLPGLAASATYQDKTYGVPYYAGSRAVIYRKDLFEAAGITSTPTTMAELEQAADKLMAANSSKKNFSAFWVPGRYWYMAMSFVHANGGKIAVDEGGTWRGTLDSPEAQAGLQRWVDFVKKYSRADRTGDEAQQPQTFAKANAAMIFANGWEWGVITDKKLGDPRLEGKLGAFPLPGQAPGDYTPTFLGGSDLAIPAKSKNRDLAIDWIAAYTSGPSMKVLVSKGSVIPNNTAQVDLATGNERLEPFAEAAAKSWFVPTAPKWADVEKAAVLQSMLVDILTDKKSVADATREASEKITETLNS